MRRAPAWLLASLMLASLLSSACSLSSVPETNMQSSSVGATPTAPMSGNLNAASGSGAAPSATAAPTAPAPAPAPAPGGAATPDTGWQVPAEQQAVVKVVEKISPAVVTVINRVESQGLSAEIRGSGVIIDSDGRIITNNHVVDGATSNSLQVSFENGDTVPVKLLGSDQISDLAVLKVDSPVPAFATLGDSSKIKVGETVIAIGSALGDLQNTVTVGVVSGLNRTLQGPGVNLENMIQTDAAINHGNSGGPLLNLSGEVIGINTAILRDTGSSGSTDVAEGLGFAIPVNTVKIVSTQLISSGKVARPFLGVSTRPINKQVASVYDLRDEDGKLLETGVLIDQVITGTEAEHIGLHEGDVLLKVNDFVVDANHALANVLTNFQPGDTVKLTVVRNGKRLEFNAKLGTRP